MATTTNYSWTTPDDTDLVQQMAQLLSAHSDQQLIPQFSLTLEQQYKNQSLMLLAI
jgi:hypothetical protein